MGTRVLRAIAALLLRGPQASSIRDDLESLLIRDLARGMSRWRAMGRCAWNLVGSAYSVWRERVFQARAAGLSLGFSWLDVKLGVRMLAKYPGLTFVGVLGMAVAIAIGASFFEAIETIADPTLPLDEGDRVVSIQTRNAAMFGDPERGSHLHDFATWNEELESVVDLGASRTVVRNLNASAQTIEPVKIAEMTASGFRLARVPPLLGRPLVEEDERAGAPHVLVIGYDVWQTRFSGATDIVGTAVRLGGTEHAIVGVMPAGFAFPVNHSYWIPFRLSATDYERGRGPSIGVFGRLAEGFALAEARAEMATIDRRLAAAFPQTHQHLRTEVLPYPHPFFDIDSPTSLWTFRLLQLVVSMLLVVVCVNVAILVYARTVTRTGEIAVRSALGASRRRLVAQLFAEAIVLSAIAAALGLAGAGEFLGRLDAFLQGRLPGGGYRGAGELPFWVDFNLSGATVAYAAVLVIVAAVIVGVLPALKATGSGVQVGLAQLGSGGAGMRLGKTWTALIVTQVAAAVAFLAPAIFQAHESMRFSAMDPTYPADQYLIAALYLDGVAEAGTYEAELSTRYTTLQSELVHRLRSEPGVNDVITMRGTPGREPGARVEVEGVPTPSGIDLQVREGATGHRVGIGRVDVDYFDTFDVALLAGRGFAAEDLDGEATAVIVNRSFAARIVGNSTVLGRRVRYVGRGGELYVDLDRWYEIVGIVDDFPGSTDPERAQATVYHPLQPGSVYPVGLGLHIGGAAPLTLAPRLQQIAAELDPGLRLGQPELLDDVLRDEQWAMRVVALTLSIVTLSVLCLSAAGIYSLMSFTVARRGREIGIRAALGAHPRRLLLSILTRALGQLAVGIVIGVAVAALLNRGSGGELVGDQGHVLLPAVAALMLIVGLLASVGPARHSLRVEPTDALKHE